MGTRKPLCERQFWNETRRAARPRFGRNIVSAGPLVMAVGLALFIAMVRRFGGDLTPREMIPSLVVAGIGMGFLVALIYQRTLIWEIGALGGIFALTFLLPPRPPSKEEQARIAAEAGITI